MNTKKEIDNKNFISVYNELIKRGDIDGQEVFTLKCNEGGRYSIQRSAVSMALNNTRNAPVSLLQATTERFNVSADYLHEGKEPMFKEPTNNENLIPNQTNDMIETIRQLHKEVISAKDEMISELKTTNLGLLETNKMLLEIVHSAGLSKAQSA